MALVSDTASFGSRCCCCIHIGRDSSRNYLSIYLSNKQTTPDTRFNHRTTVWWVAIECLDGWKMLLSS